MEFPRCSRGRSLHRHRDPRHQRARRRTGRTGDHRRLQPGEPVEGPPGRAPWFREFHHRVRLDWNQGQMGIRPNGSDQVRRPARSTRRLHPGCPASSAGYRRRAPGFSWPCYREHAQREAQARREGASRPGQACPPGRRSGPHRRQLARDRTVAWLAETRLWYVPVACPVARSETVCGGHSRTTQIVSELQILWSARHGKPVPKLMV